MNPIKRKAPSCSKGLDLTEKAINYMYYARLNSYKIFEVTFVSH